MGSIPGSGRSPGGGHGNPLQYSCLENPREQRSLVGYSPQGGKESDTTEATQHAQRAIRERRFLIRKEEEREKLCDDRGRDWSDMFITKNYRHCWTAGGEAWDELSLSSFRRNQSCPHLLSSDFWIKFCGLKPPTLIALLRQPKGTNTFANLSCLPTVTPPKPWEGQEFCLVYSLCVPHSRPIVGAQ